MSADTGEKFNSDKHVGDVYLFEELVGYGWQEPRSSIWFLEGGLPKWWMKARKTIVICLCFFFVSNS